MAAKKTTTKKATAKRAAPIAGRGSPTLPGATVAASETPTPAAERPPQATAHSLGIFRKKIHAPTTAPSARDSPSPGWNPPTV